MSSFFKKFIPIMVLAILLGGWLVAPVWAADIGLGDKGLAKGIATQGGYASVSDTTLSQSIGQVIKAVLGFVGTIFFILTIYAGILWMTASGNEEQVEKATGILRAAVIGIIITLAAYGITLTVLTFTTHSTSADSSNCESTAGYHCSTSSNCSATTDNHGTPAPQLTCPSGVNYALRGKVSTEVPMYCCSIK